LRLADLLRRLVGFVFAVTALVAPIGAMADGSGARILVVGMAPGASVGADTRAADALVTFDRLPQTGAVAQALFGARLRANPVTTFPDTRPAPLGAFEEFFLVIRAELGEGDTGPRLSLGGEALTIPGFGTRLAGTAEAFDARFRRVVFLDIVDPDNAFPAAMPAFRAALDPLGFDMQVVMISAEGAQACGGLQPLHLSIASGLGDRAPFGDADGATTQAEAESYLSDALRRAVARGCGPAYSLIFKAADDPGAVVVAHPLVPSPEVEDGLEREAFEAMFLGGTDNVAALADYLAACTYCPGEAKLSARLQAMAARARIADLEDEMWADIRDDTRRERLAIYVDHCTLCLHSDEALTRIERLDAAAAATDRERRAFLTAQGGRDLAGLRDYVETCVACVQVDEARALIAELEADGAYQAERGLLSEALEGQTPMALQAYLDGCAFCDGAGEAQDMLDRLAALAELRAPCLAVAGLPQMGGPRKLEDIDQAKADTSCGKVAAAFPDDGLVRVMQGRIAQAAGDVASAAAAYAYGMEKGVPAAFGLAAYAQYAPVDGGAIDPMRVEQLALAGAQMGDWLSQEVLTVLYSKDLVPGKSGRAAFEVALKIAEEGDPLAQYFVGHYFMTGVGTDASLEKAALWLEKAVEAGYSDAGSPLAQVYEQATGAAARPGLAAELYWSALGQGDAAATQHLTTELAKRSAEVVRIIQGKLREQGLYRGAVDGVPGPGTEAAIRAYANSLGSQG